jgi:5'-nucleotidase (lipoprotein e(P4) family)
MASWLRIPSMTSIAPRPCAVSTGRTLRTFSCLGALVALSACVAPAHTTAVPAPAVRAVPAVRSPELPLALRWMRRSAEYRALTRQTYAVAAARLDDTVPTLTGVAWGVILDADETLLDNSEYERRRATLDSAYTEGSWAEWVNEGAAPEVPGAVAFTRRVHRLGGRVVVVTNRADALCRATRRNLVRVGVTADLVLCQPPGQPDKNPRVRAVQRGTASTRLPPLKIVEWIGDNIQDFPGLTQAVLHDPSAFGAFGHTFFVLPNPVYGSWQGNAGP